MVSQLKIIKYSKSSQNDKYCFTELIKLFGLNEHGK